MDLTGDPPTIDPYGNTSFNTKGFAAYVYSRLYKYQAGPGIKGADVKPTPDIAEKAESSPDGLKWTVTLRQGAKFHNVAPVNGRAVTTDDVKFSWGRATAKVNTNAAQFAFVDKIEFPDARTIVFSLKEPNVAFLDVLSDANLLWVMPTESDGKFNPATAAVGSGPWIFDSYTASVGMKFKKNPEWYVAGFPLMDGVDVSISTEYANRLAQFRAGNTDTAGINAADLADVNKQNKDIVLVGELSQQTSYLYFDADAGAPWRDARVRQAISMAIDRDGLNELAFEIKKLKAAGIAVVDNWNNFIPAGMTRWWLDPKSPKHGDSGKFFQYNVAEAKKLLTAAGFANGFDIKFQYAGNRYGKDFNDMAEAQGNFLQALGLKVQIEVQDYNTVYINQTSVGNFKGLAFGPETPFPEVGGYVLRNFTDNPKNRGKINDAAITRLVADQQRESSEEKRREMLHEIQRLNAAQMYYISSQYRASTNWTGHQPWVKGGDTFLTTGFGSPTETYPYRWKTRQS